jgi:hypothetical protein
MRAASIFLTALCAFSPVASAATASFRAASGPSSHPMVSFGRSPSAVQIANGVPANARIHEFLITTDSDIQEFDSIEFLATPPIALYQVPYSGGGSDTSPPPAFFESFIPKLGADSWVTTPAQTHTLDNSEPFPKLWPFFDIVDSGPVTDFMFARITVTSPGAFRMTGRVGVVGSMHVESINFDFLAVPEPAGMALAAVGAIGMLAVGRGFGIRR